MSDKPMYWSEVAMLTHATQVEKFGWCACEDSDSSNPYDDCPKGDDYSMCACPCGCVVPLDSGVCVDCNDGEHQNGNGLAEYDGCSCGSNRWTRKDDCTDPTCNGREHLYVCVDCGADV